MPTTVTSLALLVAFVLPGFVTVLIQERTFGREAGNTQLDRLLRALYYSGWSYLLLAVVAVLVPGLHRGGIERFIQEHDGDPAQLVVLGTAILLIPSSAIAYFTQRWSGSKWRLALLNALDINTYHGVDSAWDHFFAMEAPVYVRIRLTSGEQILGFYGKESFAAYARDSRDLYLQHVFQETKEGWFGQTMPNSRGAWISTSEVVAIEFYDPGDESGEHADSAGPEDRGGAPAADGDDDVAADASSASRTSGA